MLPQNHAPVWHEISSPVSQGIPSVFSNGTSDQSKENKGISRT